MKQGCPLDMGESGSIAIARLQLDRALTKCNFCMLHVVVMSKSLKNLYKLDFNVLFHRKWW